MRINSYSIPAGYRQPLKFIMLALALIMIFGYKVGPFFIQGNTGIFAGVVAGLFVAIACFKIAQYMSLESLFCLLIKIAIGG